MDAVRPVQAAPSSPLAADAGVPASGKFGWASTFGLAPVVLGLLTAMFYLNGRAYFLGYLSYFHLDTAMFDDDLNSQVTQSVVAWTQVIHSFSTWIFAQLKWAVWAIALFPLACYVLLCIGTGIGRLLLAAAGHLLRPLSAPAHWIGSRRWTQSLAAFIRHWFAPPSFAKAFMRRVFQFFSASYFLYLAFWGVSCALLVLVVPFHTEGRDAARADVTARFASSPSVSIAGAGAEATIYRLIVCAPRYCAIYDGHRAITVPSAAVQRTESPAPGPAPTKTLARRDPYPN